MTTALDIQQHRERGNWRQLANIAQDMVREAEARAKRSMGAKLGGSTCLMLALDHRIVLDVDIFFCDVQWLGYLTPRLNTTFRHRIDSYEEDAGNLKLNLPEGGIDFLVCMDLLQFEKPYGASTASGTGIVCGFPLEHPIEVLAKKLFYRVTNLTPHDVFDWWSTEQIKPNLLPKLAMAQLLGHRLDVLDGALVKLGQSSHSEAQWNRIFAPNKPVMSEVIAWAREQIKLYQKLAMEKATRAKRTA